MSPEAYIFNSPTIGKLNFDQTIVDLIGYMSEDHKNKYVIVVGSDSHANFLNGSSQDVEFVTALVIHRIGKGGRYYWRKESAAKIRSLRQRIYQETYLSLGLAQKLIKKLQLALKTETENMGLNYKLEIHIDIGEQGETRDMIKEIVGLVKGNGFNAKTKPESFGASKVADKHV